MTFLFVWAAPLPSYLRSLEAFEGSLVFADSGHASDRRKRSQFCLLVFQLIESLINSESLLHLTNKCCCRGWFAVSSLHATDSPWTKSKAAGGVIGPVQRARVADLVSNDDKPLSPGQRVSWFLFKLNFCWFLEAASRRWADHDPLSGPRSAKRTTIRWAGYDLLSWWLPALTLKLLPKLRQRNVEWIPQKRSLMGSWRACPCLMERKY